MASAKLISAQNEPRNSISFDTVEPRGRSAASIPGARMFALTAEGEIKGAS